MISRRIKDLFALKDSENLSVSHILDFFTDQRTENSNLEFKSSISGIDDLLNEISAFLNAEGGVIIVGAPVEKEQPRGNRYCQGELNPVGAHMTETRVMQHISTGISPVPNGIKIYDFNYNSGKIIVIDIPSSRKPPHQVRQSGKYYFRWGTEAKPAPHGIVETLFKRRDSPNLDISLNFLQSNYKRDKLKLIITNDSYYPAIDVVTVIEVYNSAVNSDDYNSIESSTLISNLRKTVGTCEKHKGRPLPRFLGFPVDLQVFHQGYPYCVHVGFWSSNQDIEFKAFLIENGKVVRWFLTSDEDNDLDLMDELKDFFSGNRLNPLFR